MTAHPSDYFKLHFIVFLWGFTAILGMLISIPAVEMVLYRTLLAAIGMGAVIFLTKNSFHLTPQNLTKILATGFIVGIHWLAFFVSARLSNASVSLVGFATGSVWTAFLEPLMGGKKIKSFEVVLGCLVVAGLYVIFSFDFEYPLGLLMGIASGLSMSFFSILNARFVMRVHPYAITFYEMIGAFLCTLVFLPFYQALWAKDHQLQLVPHTVDWLYLAVLAWVCTVYAYSAGVELLKRLSVFFIQLTLNLEPVYGIVMAVIILGEGEKMQLSFYLGAGIIISSVIFYPFLKARFAKS